MEKPRYTSYGGHKQNTTYNEDCHLFLCHRFFLHENHSLLFAQAVLICLKYIIFLKNCKFFQEKPLQAAGVWPAGV